MLDIDQAALKVLGDVLVVAGHALELAAEFDLVERSREAPGPRRMFAVILGPLHVL